MVLVFADDYITTHPFASEYISDLDTLCLRDYKQKFFNVPIQCLDLDEYENSHIGQNDCTMDAAIGVGTYSDNHVIDKRFLLIELRLGYTNDNNLELHKMNRKISHSRDLLSDYNICNKYYFVFTKEVAPRATHLFSMKKREIKGISNWCSITPEGLKSEIEYSENQPYTPINTASSIHNAITSSYSKGVNDLVNCYGYWHDQIEQYQLKHNISEAKHITTTLLLTISSLQPDNDIDPWKNLMLPELQIKMNAINKNYPDNQ